MLDFLVERASEDYEPINFDFLNEDLMAVLHDEEESLDKTCWKLYFDGASNALGHEIKDVLVTLEGEYCPFMARLDFDCTNNVAEYEACVMGLQTAIDKKGEKIRSIWRFGINHLSITRRLANSGVQYGSLP